MNKRDRPLIFSKFGGKCSYCGCELTKGWHVDHFQPIVRDFKYNSEKGIFQSTSSCRKPENDCLENYMPSCASCNIMKSSLPLESFRDLISGFINSLNAYSTQYKVAKRYGLVTENIKPIQFYFETYKQ